MTDTQPNGTATTARHAAEPSVGQLVSDASTHLSTIIQGEIALAKLELRTSVKSGLTGIGFFVAALVLVVFSLTFGLIAVAEVLGRYLMPRWAGYACVFGFFVFMAGLLVFLGVKKVRKIKAPERTLSTSRDTVAYLKASTRRT